mmetsp:Transcript_19804/g.53007  ORF Transcript_19804/g.53007 Transcript_19804/m.53007 type:complete len:390 (+) Transcript_19804:1908-3077(+)
MILCQGLKSIDVKNATRSSGRLRGHRCIPPVQEGVDARDQVIEQSTVQHHHEASKYTETLLWRSIHNSEGLAPLGSDPPLSNRAQQVVRLDTELLGGQAQSTRCVEVPRTQHGAEVEDTRKDLEDTAGAATHPETRQGSAQTLELGHILRHRPLSLQRMPIRQAQTAQARFAVASKHLVEDVKGSLPGGSMSHAPSLQKKRLGTGLYVLRKRELQILPETGGVGVSRRACVAKGLEDLTRHHEPVLHRRSRAWRPRVFASGVTFVAVAEDRLDSLRLSGTTFSRDHQRMVFAPLHTLQRHLSSGVGVRHTHGLVHEGVHNVGSVLLRTLSVRIDSQQHVRNVRVNLALAIPDPQVLQQVGLVETREAHAVFTTQVFRERKQVVSGNLAL